MTTSLSDGDILIPERSKVNSSIKSLVGKSYLNNKKQIRQHVNPLARKYQIPQNFSIDSIETDFKNIHLPFIIDDGCSKGTWALKMAELNPSNNFLGLEIRKIVVDEARRRRDKAGVLNVNYLFANANVDLNNIVTELKIKSTIEAVTIQFPDPHFKKKHHKRRVFNSKFVDLLSQILQPGKNLFIQSDVYEVIEDMKVQVLQNNCFRVHENYNLQDPSLNLNPYSVQTEREISCLSRKLPIYRLLFVRCEPTITNWK